jgi:hypothetical protein
MKKILFSITFSFCAFVTYAQLPVKPDYNIKLDSTYTHPDFDPVWKTAILNQVIAIRDFKGQPLMLICLPANGSHSPTPGTYNFMYGKKKVVKKGTQIAKIQYEPNLLSIDGGGVLTITENESIFKFVADNITLIDTKTKKEHKVSFNFSLFIEKQ